jgi:hypothetical protein
MTGQQLRGGAQNARQDRRQLEFLADQAIDLEQLITLANAEIWQHDLGVSSPIVAGALALAGVGPQSRP